MRSRSLFLCTLLWTLAAGVAATPARADRRSFAFSYGYQTLPRGGLELEYYLDADIRRYDNPATTPTVERGVDVGWKHAVELEYGLLDRLDLGLYTVFSQSPFDRMGFEGVKVRSRYRFGDDGRYWLNAAVLLEVVAFRDEVAIEQALILQKRWRGLEVVLNLKLEEGWTLGSGPKEFFFEFIPSLGIAYHFAPWFALGVEYVAKVEVEDGEVSHQHLLGPALSFSARRFYATLGLLPELYHTGGTRLRFLARALLGVSL